MEDDELLELLEEIRAEDSRQSLMHPGSIPYARAAAQGVEIPRDRDSSELPEPGLSPGNSGENKSLVRLVASTASLHLVVEIVAYFVTARGEAVSVVEFWKLFQQNLLTIGIVFAIGVVCTVALATRFWRMSPIIPLVLTLVGTVLVTGAAYGVAEFKKESARRKLDSLFLKHRWVAFDSPSFFPLDPDPAKRNPEPEQLLRELKALHDLGEFDGLITFHFHDPKSADYRKALPWLAKEAGFKAMIAGIYVDREPERAAAPDGQRAVQTQRAIAFERAAKGDDNIIVAYCLGHNVSTGIPLHSLAEWMNELRLEVGGKPVSSTFAVIDYLGERGRMCRQMGDYLIPDVHAAWHNVAAPQAALAETRQFLDQLTVLPGDRPVMLKMIMFPSDGAIGASEDAQKEFFEGVVRDLPLPRGVHASVFGYDPPFKRSEELKEQFALSEIHTGLLTKDRVPKPALEVVRKRWPIQNRP